VGRPCLFDWQYARLMLGAAQFLST
jgi:hypothetical protein